jgi:succinyl-CoA synthetase beta subunit
MATTYEPIATTTLTGTSSSIVFSSIPATYTDLRLIIGSVYGSNPRIRFNSDSATNYSATNIYGDGSTAASYPQVNLDAFNIYAFGPGAGVAAYFMDIFSYAGSTYKTSLVVGSEDKNGAGGAVNRQVNLWRSTSAINNINIFSTTNFTAGTTITLYGILKA